MRKRRMKSAIDDWRKVYNMLTVNQSHGFATIIIIIIIIRIIRPTKPS